MKKITAVLLSILMIMSAFGCFAAFGEEIIPTVISTDGNPIIESEIEGANYTPVFYLNDSVLSYSFLIVLPDGSAIPLETEGNTDEDRVDEKYRCYGYAYVDFKQFKEAKEKDEGSVPVHVAFTLYEKNKNNYGYTKVKDYYLSVRKALVSNYIKSITPIDNINDYAYENSETAFLQNTVFEVEYYNGVRKTLVPEIVSFDERYHYTLDGNPLAYDVNHDMNRVFVSYFDASCSYELKEIRTFPFSAIRFIGCKLQGDMPTEIIYEVQWRENDVVVKYTKPVSGYSGYVDMLEGYPVTFSTEGSKYTSTVEVSLGELSNGKTYELQQQSLLQRIIGKLVWFFKQIFATGIF